MPRKEYQAFASSFLDLWQEQMARAMADTDFLQALMDNMQQMQAGAFGYEQKRHETDRYTADASRARDDELDDVRQRLAACERKVIKLEATIDRLKAEKKRATAKRSVAAPRAAAKPAKRAAAKPKTTKAVAKKSAKKTSPPARKRAGKRK